MIAGTNNKIYEAHLLGANTHLTALMNAYDALFFDESANTVTTKFLSNSNYTHSPAIATHYGLKMYVKKMTITCTFRNNYNLPADIDIAWITAKQSTNISPVVKLLADFTDSGIPAEADLASPLYGWKMRNPHGDFSRHWKINWSKKYRLLPGQEITVVAVHRGSKWVKSEMLAHESGTNYLKGYTDGFLMALSGAIGHEGDLSNLGFMPAKLDIMIQRDYQWCFPNTLQRDTAMVNTQTLGATDMEVVLPGRAEAIQETVIDPA